MSRDPDRLPIRTVSGARTLMVHLVALGFALGFAPGGSPGNPARASAAFERPPHSPGAAALGGVISLDPEPGFGNPAARSGSAVGSRFAASGERPFGIASLHHVHASAHHGAGTWGLGVGFRQLGTMGYAEREARLVASAAPDPRIAVGLAIRALAVTAPGFAPRRSAALDAGFRAVLSPEVEVAAVLESVAGETPGNAIGRRTSIGITRSLPAGLHVHLETTRREPRPLSVIVGVSCRVSRFLALRAGMKDRPGTVAWGFGVSAGAARLSLSSSHVGRLGRTVRVGLSWAGTESTPASPKKPQELSREADFRRCRGTGHRFSHGPEEHDGGPVAGRG